MDKFDRSKSGGNKTNLSNLSASKNSIGTDYLTSVSAKKRVNNCKSGGNNTKKGIKAARNSNYLTLNAEKTFNHLWHAFIQALIVQHFDPKWHIQIETNASGYSIDGISYQLTLKNLR